MTDPIANYVAQMWDALHLSPEQRAQAALDNVQQLAMSLSKPVQEQEGTNDSACQ